MNKKIALIVLLIVIVISAAATITFSGDVMNLSTSLSVAGGSALTTTNQTGTGSLAMSASPAFTGTPTAPTASAQTNTTQVATTAYVQQSNNIPAAALIAGSNGQCVNTSGGVAQWGTCSGLSGVTTVHLASQYSNNTTSGTQVMTLGSFSSNTNYYVQCDMYYTTSATTLAPGFGMSGPASPTAIATWIEGIYNLTAATGLNNPLQATLGFANQNGFTGNVAGSFMYLPNSASQSGRVTLYLLLNNGANAGTINLYAAASSTGTITIAAGSACRIYL